MVTEIGKWKFTLKDSQYIYFLSLMYNSFSKIYEKNEILIKV